MVCDNLFVKPSRTGRMLGVNISIDGETWEFVLNNAGIPIDTPLSEIKIRRYRCKDGRIILKVMRDTTQTAGIGISPAVDVSPCPNPEPPQTTANRVSVSKTVLPIYAFLCHGCNKTLPGIPHFDRGKQYCDDCYTGEL